MRHGIDITDIAPHEDYGFFGPDSVTWKVFTYPTATTVAFLRTVAIEVLEPFVLASVNDTQSVMRRPKLRYDRTLQYTATIAFADSAAVVKAADTLLRIHRNIVGPEPVGGGQYDANDPRGQLWIHLTQWHSLLYVYEKFGPGKLSPAEELQYWTECRRAAAFQTIDPDDVPRDRDEVRAYFASMRPRLAGSEVAQQHVQAILGALGILDDFPVVLRPLRPALWWFLRTATISTLPRWLRPVAGVHQSRVTDSVITLSARACFGLADRSTWLQVALLAWTSSLAYPVMAPVLFGIPPRTPVTVTPAEAWRRAGRPGPREQYQDQLATRREKTLAQRGSTHDADLLPFV